MGWQSYHHVVRADTPEQALLEAKMQVDETYLDDGPTGTVLEQDGYTLVLLPAICELTEDEAAKLPYGETRARTQAFERRLAETDRARSHHRTNYRSWIADLGDGTMVVFGWAYAG